MIYADQNERQALKLDPVARQKVNELLERLDELGIEILIASGARTEAEQDELYAQGRSKPGKVVTHVRDGDSLHTWALAIDVVPITSLGMADWNNAGRYEEIARVAKELGFEWGFAMWGFDKPHFQYTQGLTVQDLRAGKRLKPVQTVHVPKTDAGREARRRRDQRLLTRLKDSAKEAMARRIQRRLLRG